MDPAVLKKHRTSCVSVWKWSFCGFRNLSSIKRESQIALSYAKNNRSITDFNIILMEKKSYFYRKGD